MFRKFSLHSIILMANFVDSFYSNLFSSICHRIARWSNMFIGNISSNSILFLVTKWMKLFIPIVVVVAIFTRTEINLLAVYYVCMTYSTVTDISNAPALLYPCPLHSRANDLMFLRSKKLHFTKLNISWLKTKLKVYRISQYLQWKEKSFLIIMARSTDNMTLPG